MLKRPDYDVDLSVEKYNNNHQPDTLQDQPVEGSVGSSTPSSEGSTLLSESSSTSLFGSTRQSSPSSLESTPEKYSNSTCKEQTSIFFLKVHKAGSTCIQNLFWRFGVTRSLSFTIFSKPFPYPDPDFKSYLLPDPEVPIFDGRYDIFCEHSKFNNEQLLEVMKGNTEYTAIVREPLSRLRSVLKFYGYGRKNNLGSDIDLADHFLSRDQVPTNRMAKNDFGIMNNTNFASTLWELDSKFSIVAVLERLDESLVLMKRAYCWKLKDILYLPMRQAAYATADKKRKEEKLRNKLRVLNEVDFLLYEYFLNRHSHQIAQEENNFAAEVKLFQDISDKAKEFCSNVCRQLGDGVARHASHNELMAYLTSDVTFPASQWEPAFSVSGLECIMMMFDPRVWRNAQKVTQYPTLCSRNDLPFPFDKTYCYDHFAYNFPWAILYNPQKYNTFLFDCY